MRVRGTSEKWLVTLEKAEVQMVVAWTKNFENHIDWEGPEGETLRTLIVAVMAAEWPIR